MRIDRLSSSSCYMPCAPPTPYNQAEASQQFDDAYSLLKQRAIRIAQATPMAQSLIQSSPNDAWSVDKNSTDLQQSFIDMTPAPSDSPQINPMPERTPSPIVVVCYCDKKGFGWRWEVHTDTNEAFL